MRSDVSDIIFLISAILASIGLSIIIYSRNKENYNSRLFVMTLLLVVGYIISHGIHFILMTKGDVTILDKSCHSFLLLINIFLTFFSINYPSERKTGSLLKSFILFPSIIVLMMLWGGLLVMDTHAHPMHIIPHYTTFYPVYIVWYLILICYSAYVVISRYRSEKDLNVKIQLLVFFIGLTITNFTSFIFGIFIPWLLGFYYLVEISPFAFFGGVIVFTSIAIWKFDMFPKAADKARNFSLNKKVFIIALIVVPVIIMLIQIPLGRALMYIGNEEWLSYFVVSLIGGLIVSISMAILINLMISSPLKELKDKALEIKRGEFSARASANSNDEIGEVCEAFNNMAETLGQNNIELKSKEQRIITLLNAFEKSQAAIAIVDTELKVIEANNTFCNLIQKQITEVINSSIIEIQFAHCPQNETDKIIAAIGNRIQYECETNFKMENTSAKILMISLSPVYFNNIDFAGYMFVEVDITERKLLEIKLQNSEKLAALGKMSAILAHEIKTPLTSIKMNADILYQGLILSDEDREAFLIMQKEISRLNNLVKEVLSLSKQTELNFENTNILLLTKNLLKQFSARAEERNIIIENKVNDIIICIDEEKIRQALINLIENSFEAIGFGGVITIDSKVNDGKIFIYISDTGIGIINPDKIFDPFMTTKASGTGLGLSIAQKIIEQHGGALRLVDSKKENTTFEVELPIGH